MKKRKTSKSAETSKSAALVGVPSPSRGVRVARLRARDERRGARRRRRDGVRRPPRLRPDRRVVFASFASFVFFVSHPRDDGFDERRRRAKRVSSRVASNLSNAHRRVRDARDVLARL